MRGMRIGTRIAAAAAAMAFGLAAAAFAEAPLGAARPKEARARVLDAALAELGAPYLYGGRDSKGFDCSGLVVSAYEKALGPALGGAAGGGLPRTARSLYSYVEPVGKGGLQPGDLVFFDTTGRLAHVGIYLGEGRFVHAASEGSRTGVIESSLEESYWARAYAGGGRLLSPAEYLGLVLWASLGPSSGPGLWPRSDAGAAAFRGAAGSFGAAYPLFGLELGLEARPEYDAALGVARLPLVLSLGLDRRLRFFAGPALTIGSPRLGGVAGADGDRGYEAAGGILATAGLEWTPLRFRLGGYSCGLFADLVYNRYLALPGEAANAGADLGARLKVGAGLSFRWGI